MAKNKNDYFQLLEKQTSCCVEAAGLLEEILLNYSAGSIPAQREKMHIIENRGDELYHDIQNRLAAEFITPIDREDILHLVQIIDDITDAIDEVVLDFYMYDLLEMPMDAYNLSQYVNHCVKALYKGVAELKNFKKPHTLRGFLAEVNAAEGEADSAFVEAVYNLFKGCENIKKLIGNKAVYESLENCCDLCEHAADVIEQIIIKNT